MKPVGNTKRLLWGAFFGAAIAISCFVFILYRFAVQFKTSDPKPMLEYWRPKQRREVGNIFPAIDVRLLVTDAPSFDVTRREFVMDVVLSFEFNSAILSLKSIGKFSVKNGTIISMADPDLRRLPNGKILASYVARIKFSSPLDYRFFPLDDHRIILTITNQYLSADDVLFRSEPGWFQFSKNIAIAEWQFVGGNVAYGTSVLSRGEAAIQPILRAPEVAFIFDFNNASASKIFTILLPMIAIFLIASFCMLLAKPRETTSIFLALNNLIALLGYRFVLQSVSPSVGYFLLSDFVFSYVLLVALIAVFFSVVTYKLEIFVPRVAVALLTCFNVGLVGLAYWLVHPAMI